MLTRTREELQQQAEALARLVCGLTAAEAWARLDRGELEGTIFASKMARLRALLSTALKDGVYAPESR